MKPWDLERMSRVDVCRRLEWIKDYQRQMRRDAEGVEDD